MRESQMFIAVDASSLGVIERRSAHQSRERERAVGGPPSRSLTVAALIGAAGARRNQGRGIPDVREK